MQDSAVILTNKWLNNIGLSDYDISGNSQEVTINTMYGAHRIIVEEEKVSCYNALSITAISSFSWIGKVPEIIDCLYRIIPYLSVEKMGWIYTTDYDIILKAVHDINTGLCFTTAYNIALLQQHCFIRFLENSCDISVKRDNISFTVPILNPFLLNAMIETSEDFLGKEGGYSWKQI